MGRLPSAQMPNKPGGFAVDGTSRRAARLARRDPSAAAGVSPPVRRGSMTLASGWQTTCVVTLPPFGSLATAMYPAAERGRSRHPLEAVSAARVHIPCQLRPVVCRSSPDQPLWAIGNGPLAIAQEAVSDSSCCTSVPRNGLCTRGACMSDIRCRLAAPVAPERESCGPMRAREGPRSR